MKHRIPLHTPKAKCLAPREEVDRDRKEILITKKGPPLARLMPVRQESTIIFGRLKNTGRIAGDILSTGEW